MGKLEKGIYCVYDDQCLAAMVHPRAGDPLVALRIASSARGRAIASLEKKLHLEKVDGIAQCSGRAIAAANAFCIARARAAS